MQNLIKNNAQRPDIYSISIIMKTGLFGSNVLFGACNSFHDDFFGAQTKICYLNNRDWFAWKISSFKQNIFGFEIPVSNPVVVEFLNTFADLINALKSILLIHFVIHAVVKSIPEL